MTTRNAETGVYYYGARYYDPKISVWLSVDPMAAKRTWLTPYNFVSNNPLLRVDPDGNLDICETCPNEPRFDEYRDSPVNYEFTPNGNGGGEIHLSNHQSLQEVEVGPGAGRINSTEVVLFSNDVDRDRQGNILPPGTAHSLNISGGAAFMGLGFNFQLGIGVDGNGDYFWLASGGYSEGFDATIGISHSMFIPYDENSSLSFRDIRGEGRSNSFGIGIIDGESGGDAIGRWPTDFNSTYRDRKVNSYREETWGASLGLPIGYMHNFNTTKTGGVGN